MQGILSQGRSRTRSRAGLPLAFALIVAIGYAFTWVAAFAGLALKTIEAVQAAMFTIVFPFVFVSSAFVPVETFREWLETIAIVNPVTIWVNTVRALTLGELYTESDLFVAPPLGTLLWQSAAWIGGILAFFWILGVRNYRRT
jgi:ABC-type multidrug transport system permease subunit